ncbi:hypothetical protein DM02DRAFT_376576 [Periconia macrospinosa]|uniref:Aromatic amino acid beta-eliminating lyase/threonine aldolase domain-containing protein n=1 Tax=Periconia macrospinosa TaxID=97972 RepID=A0A2V1DU60_9PLEO|nr:hypothetical protein DM02DRAFT_376576 [Periconia macrospinosa]
MLEGIINNTLLNDVMMKETTTNSFQDFMASLTRNEAGLLVSSGIIGNLVSLRTTLQVPPYAILCDTRSRILPTEAGGDATLRGALILYMWRGMLG